MDTIKVLIVDDDEVAVKFIEKCLNKLGYIVADIASTGEGAITKFEECKPDVVLMDIELESKMDGIEAAEKIKLSSDVPVIYLTSHADEKIIKRAKITEPFGYIIKPMKERELHANISMALYKKKMELERKRVEEELKKYRNQLEDEVGSRTRELNFQKHALDEHAIVSATDIKGNIIYANDKFCDISGYSIDELMGKNHRIVKSGEHPPEFYRDMWDTISNGKVWHGEVKNNKKDGGFYWVKATMVPFMDEKGKPHRYVSIRTDITKRKQIEEALREAKEKAEVATKLKDKFVGIVAHDLKSPFASMTGLLSLVLDDKKHSLFPKHQVLIEKVLESGGNLNNLIDRLLNINRLQTGKVKLHPKFIDAFLLVNSHLASLAYHAEQKGIKLENQVPRGTRIYVDFDLFGEVIQNLLSNAIKFCKKGDTIKAFSVKNEGTDIAVSDTGVGIDDWLLNKVFKHEEKTSTIGTGGEKGIGLGLPFCYDIVKAHGGSLAFESVKGKGTTFYAKLPTVRPSILVVDDDLSMRKLLIKKLQSVEANIVEAENGEIALKIIENEEPHLILLDIVMPGIDGFEVLERIRNQIELRSLPVIVITSDNNTETRNRAFHLGANDFITKPIKAEDLIPRVRKFVK